MIVVSQGETGKRKEGDRKESRPAKVFSIAEVNCVEAFVDSDDVLPQEEGTAVMV